jgi:hypothetical protein
MSPRFSRRFSHHLLCKITALTLIFTLLLISVPATFARSALQDTATYSNKFLQHVQLAYASFGSLFGGFKAVQGRDKIEGCRQAPLPRRAPRRNARLPERHAKHGSGN